MSVPSARVSRGGESEERLEEERDELNRRRKKVRFAEEEFSGGESLRAREEKWMQTEGQMPTPKSYRESLLQNVNSKVCWWEWSKNDEDELLEDYGASTDFAKVLNPNDGINVDLSNPLCPKFLLEEKERERLMKPFQRTLIVKLLGRQTTYGFMVKKLRQIWERKGKIDIFDLENDFYLVTLQHMDDYIEALTGGPWVINDAYLNVARWCPDFSPKNEKIDSVVAWVRFPYLPAPLFDKKFLLNLGNAIGKAVRLDIHTVQRARGKFARMCVELDLTKPLVPEFDVEGQVLSVVYESLGALCKKCGRVGHERDGCDEYHRKSSEGIIEVETTGGRQKAATVIEIEKELWRTVQRSRRQGKSVMPKPSQLRGSRFSVLEVEEADGVRKVEEVRGQERINKEEVKEKAHGDGFLKQQRRNGRYENMGSEVSKTRAMGMKVQEERIEKEEKLENGLVKNKGRSGSSRSKVAQNVQSSYECVPETNNDMYKSQRAVFSGMENLNPGEYVGRLRGKEDMDPGELQMDEEEEDLIESIGMSVDSGCATPLLADDR